MSDLKSVAESVSKALLEEGFKIHRYDAFSTKSIYLKLDYGACGSIRISDHPGYGHLNYRWNIGDHIEEVSHEKMASSHPRSYYPAGKWSRMVSQIVKERARRMAVGGPCSYERKIELCKHDKRTATKGFWRHPSTYEVTP